MYAHFMMDECEILWHKNVQMVCKTTASLFLKKRWILNFDNFFEIIFCTTAFIFILPLDLSRFFQIKNYIFWIILEIYFK